MAHRLTVTQTSENCVHFYNLHPESFETICIADKPGISSQFCSKL